MNKIRRYVGYSELLLAICLLALAVVMVFVARSNAATRTPSSSTDYKGPFITETHVPAACVLPVTDNRYYTANAPAGTVELRTGGHGHGGYLKCIMITLDGPAMYPGDHPYTKWLIFPGLGLKIPQPDGIVANYQDCFQRGTTNGLPYRFPSSLQPGDTINDCGEAYLLKDGGTWVDPGGNTLYPSSTP